MKRLTTLVLFLLCLLPLVACARQPQLIDVQVVDLDEGNTLSRLPFEGRDYLEGQPGHRFSVTMQNRTGERVLAVLSVDGVNAISGQTASASQAGYVLEPWQRVEIRGWRKSYSDVAEFYFTDLPDSYAARTGRPQNVGVIGVAAFRERRYEPAPYSPPPQVSGRYEQPASPYESNKSAADATASAPAAEGAMRRATAQEIGTGHGERRYDPVTQTTFERESSRPNQVQSLFYDSHNALAERGVIPTYDYPRRPDAFPIGFAPDPSR